MEYLFESAKGKQITIDYEIGKAPKLFSVIKVGGVTYKRVPALGTISVEPNLRIKSHQLPRWYKHAERFDAHGRVLLDGKKERNELMAKANHEGEKLDWD